MGTLFEHRRLYHVFYSGPALYLIMGLHGFHIFLGFRTIIVISFIIILHGGHLVQALNGPSKRKKEKIL